MLNIENVAIFLVGVIATVTQDVASPTDSASDLATLIGSWAIAITGVLTIAYGIFEKRLAHKSGTQENEKNAFDQLVDENELLIKKIRLMRKDSDKWHIVRHVLLETEGGRDIIKGVEETSDEVSSDEE